jgi:hypothetical protein
MLIFFVTNENKLARFQIRQFIGPLDHKSSIIECLSRDDLIESAAKRVVSKHAESDRTFPTLKSLWGPFDEFDKVVEKRRFGLILDRRIDLCPDWNCVGHRDEKRESHGAELHVTVRSPQGSNSPAPLPQTASQSVRMIQSHLLCDHS